MARSILTAQYIAAACRLQPVALPDLFEKGGIYELRQDGRRHGLPGPNRRQLQERFPQLVLPESVGEEGWFSRPAESDATFLRRMRQMVAGLLGRHLQTDDRLALVAHGDVMDQVVNLLMDTARRKASYDGPWEARWAFHNTSISRIDFHGAAPTVVYLNRIDHLPPEMVTW